MYEINFKEPSKGKNKVLINGKPNIKNMSQQDFAIYISTLETEIRNFYKEENKFETKRKDIPP